MIFDLKRHTNFILEEKVYQTDKYKYVKLVDDCWMSGRPLPLQEEARLEGDWCRTSLLYSSPWHASPLLDSRVLPLQTSGRAIASFLGKKLSSWVRMSETLSLDRHIEILFLPGGKSMPFLFQYSSKITLHHPPSN